MCRPPVQQDTSMMMSDKRQSPQRKVSWVLIGILAAIALVFFITSFLVQTNG